MSKLDKIKKIIATFRKLCPNCICGSKTKIQNTKVKNGDFLTEVICASCNKILQVGAIRKCFIERNI